MITEQQLKKIADESEIKVLVFSVYDEKAQVFNSPFTAENFNIAERNFQESCKNIPYRADLKLYCLGSYSTKTGLIEAVTPVMYVSTGKEVEYDRES